MIKELVKRIFDVREGEFRVSFWMLSYIFLIIAVLLIIKPTVNSLFLSELGVKQLPFAFLMVALVATGSSFLYTKAVESFPLNQVIKITLLSSITVLVLVGVLLSLNLFNGFLLYFFYCWVAIYAVLSASQFWVLANLIYNVREAKRLFGFIGSGAILGGIIGGYLTSILAPFIGNENLIFVASILLIPCLFLLHKIWSFKEDKVGSYRKAKNNISILEKPFRLILDSKHLTYIACILAVSVLVAKLVDYLFSDFAAAAFYDAEELTSFFGFWFSTFNLLSLVVQLFITQRIVGIWGVGFSLLLLPLGIFGGSLLFLVLPELSAVVVIKSMDGILKQSIHKSATELLSLPLPFDLKNRTKSFIDVVVDSIATGIAGCLLIFIISGLEWPSQYIGVLILVLVCLWLYFIYKVRIEYYKTFRSNLEVLTNKTDMRIRPFEKKESVIQGMRSVLKNGTEKQLLFMLDKLMEINDPRFADSVEQLLDHPSNMVKTSAIRNLYFLNSKSMTANVPQLLMEDNPELTIATLSYVLRFAENDNTFIFDRYLNDDNGRIAISALYCLAREARTNEALRVKYSLEERLTKAINALLEDKLHAAETKTVIDTLGIANFPKFYPYLTSLLHEEDEEIVQSAILAIGETKYLLLTDSLIPLLSVKKYRKNATSALVNFGPSVLQLLKTTVEKRTQPIGVIRFIPHVIQQFYSKRAIHHLLELLNDNDLTVRLEVIKSLSILRNSHPHLKFNRYKVINTIYEECKLYHQTMAAMHSQIIVSYRNRKKTKKEITDAEREARTSLLELLERRLDAGLERIFKLLGLRYQQKDIEIAYEALRSEKQEAQLNAIEFLDNLLTGELKRKLLPIIEDSALDISSEEELQKLKHKIPSEMECFQWLLEGHDLKLKLAVLHLIQQQKDSKYATLVGQYLEDNDPKIRTFAKEALEAIVP